MGKQKEGELISRCSIISFLSLTTEKAVPQVQCVSEKWGFFGGGGFFALWKLTQGM